MGRGQFSLNLGGPRPAKIACHQSLEESLPGLAAVIFKMIRAGELVFGVLEKQNIQTLLENLTDWPQPTDRRVTPELIVFKRDV